ncbi:hypothetical protein ACFSKN_04630 [Mariniflexile gromovii]|uniref:Uncharacterized protein n=1 Tax=Mariniflexile gromovii TaxID=362523 RepID=A0ABS4BWC0_9FLAO|nr:hypothetical protein [Mariniflexile gromovii]MBP0904867.1 hypothetical protein [Mariniflexile gromovii]
MSTNTVTIFTKEFKDRLETLLKTIDKTFENINAGGCAHFAKFLYPHLKELTDDIKVIYCQYYGSNDHLSVLKEYFNDYVKSGDIKDLDEIETSHLMLVCEGYYIDSSGLYKSFKDFKKKNNILMFDEIGEVKFEELDTWCNNRKWNKVFEKKQLPKIQKVINKYFNKKLTIMERLNIYASNQ